MEVNKTAVSNVTDSGKVEISKSTSLNETNTTNTQFSNTSQTVKLNETIVLNETDTTRTQINNSASSPNKDTGSKDRLNVTVDSKVEIVDDKTYFSTIIICATVFTTIAVVSILIFVIFYKRSKKPTPIINIIQQQST